MAKHTCVVQVAEANSPFSLVERLVPNPRVSEVRVRVSHPEMANFYGAQVDALHEALGGDAETARLEAASVMHMPIKDIALTLEGDQLKIDVRGDLAGTLAISTNEKAALSGRAPQDPSPAEVTDQLAAQKARPKARLVAPRSSFASCRGALKGQGHAPSMGKTTVCRNTGL
jgi:hypothetical protein